MVVQNKNPPIGMSMKGYLNHSVGVNAMVVLRKRGNDTFQWVESVIHPRWPKSVKTLTYGNSTEWIETGEAGLRFEASMATWAKHDVPEAWVEIRNEHDQVLYTSHRLSSQAATWTQQEVAVPIPPGAQTARVILRGTRTHGDDNDSYFDDLSVGSARRSAPFKTVATEPASVTID